jgi:hypothetical protein
MNIRLIIALALLTISNALSRAQGFAPDSLASLSAVGAISSGNGIFAQVGAFRVTLSRTGTTFALQSFNPTYLNSLAGDASYAKTGPNTGRMSLTDVVLRIAIPYSLIFTSPTSATFTVTTGVGNQAGVMILENITVVQNVLPAPVTQVTTVAGLSNMSVRTIVPTNGQVIPGLVLDSPTRVLVRVAGPALGAFGVTGTLPNPRLTVLNGSTVVATNDDWSDSLPNQIAIQSAALRTGAFSFAVMSKDAAILLDLAAGSYTCLVAGEPGTTGEVILEVYRVPQ